VAIRQLILSYNKRRHMASLLKIDLAKIHAPQVFVLTTFSNHIIYLHCIPHRV
jgi:hypothetical protein